MTPLEDPEEYCTQSPVTYAERITTPLLIVHSENDLRCPIEQAEELFIPLRLLGREVELVRFPGEGHELSRSGSRATASNAPRSSWISSTGICSSTARLPSRVDGHPR